MSKLSELIVLHSIRNITKEVAAAVVKEALEEDLAEGYRGVDARELQRFNQVLACSFRFKNLV